MLIQNVICFMSVSFKYFLDLLPSFSVSTDNINNFYCCDTFHLEDMLSLSENNGCRKQGDAESGVIVSHVKGAVKNSSMF